MTTPSAAGLEVMLRGLKLPAFVTHQADLAIRAQREGWSFGQYLHALAELEYLERRERRVARLRKLSALPAEKTLAALDRQKLPKSVQRQLPQLCDGGFVDRGENLLLFGLPGRGKTHLACAIGHELVMRGHPVLFVAAHALVQRLLVAKRDLALERELKHLDHFDAVIVDDIGYVQQNRDEMEVLFTFLAERYEHRTVIITSNLVFSSWDKIFKDPMTTAAAIDRIVHHATILELDGPSIRSEVAKQRNVDRAGDGTGAQEVITGEK